MLSQRKERNHIQKGTLKMISYSSHIYYFFYCDQQKLSLFDSMPQVMQKMGDLVSYIATSQWTWSQLLIVHCDDAIPAWGNKSLLGLTLSDDDKSDTKGSNKHNETWWTWLLHFLVFQYQ